MARSNLILFLILQNLFIHCSSPSTHMPNNFKSTYNNTIAHLCLLHSWSETKLTTIEVMGLGYGSQAIPYITTLVLFIQKQSMTLNMHNYIFMTPRMLLSTAWAEMNTLDET